MIDNKRISVEQNKIVLTKSTIVNSFGKDEKVYILQAHDQKIQQIFIVKIRVKKILIFIFLL